MSAGGQRVVVLGAGIVGASAALFLQADGHEVTLLDRLAPGAGTSAGNAGVISLGSCVPIATPETLRKLPALLADPLGPLAVRWPYLPSLLPWLLRVALACRPAQVAATTAALAALLAHADQAHDSVIQRAGLGDLVRRGGWLKVARDRAALLAATAAERAACERHGIELVLLADGETLDLEPALAGELRAGLLMPHNRAVRDPRRYVERIVQAFVRDGGHVVQAEALDFPPAPGRVALLRTTAGPLPLDQLVIAAGAFSRRFARLAGAPVPLEAERGYHAMLAHPEPTLARPVYFVEHGFLLAPMEPGLRLTGGVELASPTAPPDDRRIRRLVPIACRLLRGLDGRILATWQGCRPSTPDSRPVIGKAPARPNVWLAFGHQHVGLTLGPLTGRLIADLIAGRDPGIDLAPFRPDRRYW